MVFQEDKAIIKINGKTIPTCFKSTRELYILNVGDRPSGASAHSSSRESGKESQLQWHKRMVHLNFGQLKLLPKMADGITFSDEAVGEGKCETCIVSKATRAILTGSSKQHDSNETKLPGEYFSTDICSVNVSDGNKGYFVTYVDHASDATLAFALASKAELVDLFKKVWASEDEGSPHGQCGRESIQRDENFLFWKRRRDHHNNG